MGGTANNPPAVVIPSPAEGASFRRRAKAFSFAGSASDSEDGTLTGSLVWISDLDGQIGTGGSFGAQVLSDGTHVITASGADSGGLAGSDSITITVAGVSGNEIKLSVVLRKVKNLRYADLSWSGANSENVDVYCNGSPLVTTDNDGS